MVCESLSIVPAFSAVFFVYCAGCHPASSPFRGRLGRGLALKHVAFGIVIRVKFVHRIAEQAAVLGLGLVLSYQLSLLLG